MKASKWKSLEDAEEEIERCLNIIHDEGPLTVEERREAAAKAMPLALVADGLSGAQLQLELAVYEMETEGYEEDGMERLQESVRMAKDGSPSSDPLRGVAMIVNSLRRRHFFTEAVDILIEALEELQDKENVMISNTSEGCLTYALSTMGGAVDLLLLRRCMTLFLDVAQDKPSVLEIIVQLEVKFGDLFCALQRAEVLACCDTGFGEIESMQARTKVAIILFELGRYEDALALVWEARSHPLECHVCSLALVELGRYEEVQSRTHLSLSFLVKSLLLLRTGFPDKALKAFYQGERQAMTMWDTGLHGEILMALGDFDAARDQFKEAVPEWSDSLVEPMLSGHRQARLMEAMNDTLAGIPEAFDNLEAAISVGHTHFPDGHPRIASAMIVRASALLEMDRRQEAKESAEEGLSMLQKFLGENHPLSVQLGLWFATSLKERQGSGRLPRSGYAFDKRRLEGSRRWLIASIVSVISCEGASLLAKLQQ